ncbi:acyltransferase family protein [Aeromonas veronii]|uniref:acyltransferase family protein n=1 Tax=Aeromonas veronii TaxID=654 RepID=UPI0005A9F08E|nr:acyltransferase [Aeromonas veronii]
MLKSYLRDHWEYLTKAGGYPGIDAARALAVSSVILFHFKWLPFGWIGVDLFFVISGFLIGGIILDKAIAKRFSMIEFYRNRALRILPVYYTMIVLCIFLKAGAKPLDNVALKSIATAATFLQTTGPYFFPNQFVIDHSFIPGGSWSLAVEEMFYIFSPLVLILLVGTTARLRSVAIVLGLIALAAIPIRLTMTSGFSPDDPNWHFASFIQFHSRFDELLAGVICAALVRSTPDLKRGSKALAVSSIVLLAIFLAFMLAHPLYLKSPQTLTRDTVWLPTLLGAMGAAFILSVYWVPIKSKMVIALARLSYPLYLMHIFIWEVAMLTPGLMDAAKESIGMHATYLIIVMLSIVFSWLMSLTVEYPFIRIYKKPVLAKQEQFLLAKR